MVMNRHLSTFKEDQKLRVEEEARKVEREKEFEETELPEDYIEKNIKKDPFLDVSVRELIDEFVLTWHKIIMDLLDFKRYDKLNKKEWWDTLIELFYILREVFWVDDRIFHIGVGFIVISFFVFFICVTNK